MDRYQSKQSISENIYNIYIHEMIREAHLGILVPAWLALHCHSADKKQNTDFFQITCFKANKNMLVKKNLRGAINFYKKLCLLVFTWNKQHLSKQVVPITYVTVFDMHNGEKHFLQLLLLKFCELFLFKQIKKRVVHFGLKFIIK